MKKRNWQSKHVIMKQMNKQTIFAVALIIVFCITMVVLLFKISNTDTSKHIRAIGYPKDTIMVHCRSCLVIEMHDLIRDTIYNDTVAMSRRVPSTLEDFDPRYRDFRERRYK